MRHLFAFFAACLVSMATSQPATRLWIKTTSTVGNDSYQDFVLDSSGNAYVCGTGIVTATGKYGFLVVKLDRNGVKLWEKLLPGSAGQSSAQKIVIDATGNSYIVGSTKVAAPATQCRIVKLSPAGAILYDVEGNAPTESLWYSVAVNSLGEATATGYVDSGAGKIMRTTHFLPSGAIAWTRDYSYPNNSIDQHGVDVRVDSSNNIYVCGVHNAFPNGCANTVVKYSRTAVQQWMIHVNNGSVNYPRRFNLLNGNEPVVACEVKQGANNLYFVNYFDTNGVQKTRVSSFNSFSVPVSIRGLDFDSNGMSYLAAAAGPDQIQHFEQPGVTNIGFLGFGLPDIRAICAGPFPHDYYFATWTGGSGARPAIISGRRIIPSANFPTQIELFDEKIFGSTANNQVPYANVNGLKTDANGDLYAIGILTGSNAVDAFIAKYETGPLANDDRVYCYAGETVTSQSSVLDNDGQFGSSQLAVIFQPQHGTLTLNSDGFYTYIPDAGFAGLDRAYYRLTRNATQVRSSTAMLEFNVVPNASSVSVTPTSVKGNDPFFVTATVSQIMNNDYLIPVRTDNSSAVGVTGEIRIGKDRNYGTQRFYAKAVTVTTNATITIQSGRTTRSTVITVTP